MPSPLSSLIDELRRRRVFRVAAFYGGIAFVIVQIIDGTFDLMGVPQWVGRVMVTLLALGFPISMILAWVFDITPDGIVRTEGRATGKPGTGNKALIAITIAAVAFGMWGWTRDGENYVGQIRSIAVLPLENLMNDPDQDYFVSGMHEALTAELSRISALRVTGRTSTMSYKANPKPIPVIAAELNVDAVIEGSVLRDGDRVRITVQLVATRPERHLWANSYDRDLRDILKLHSEVARAIAEEIKITLTPGERAHLAERKQISPEAHEAYLKGLYHWNLRTQDSFDRAVGYFQASVDIDTTYALAYAGLALAYQLQGEYAFMSAEESYPKAILNAQKALTLDPNLAEAHTALAAARLYYQHDWVAAEAGYHKAIELNPGYATAYQWLSEWNTFKGNFEVALALAEKSMSLDPLSKVMQLNRAIGLGLLGRHDEALAQHEETAKMYPGIDSNTMWSARALLQAGRVDEAVELDLEIMRHYADSTNDLSNRLRASYARGGFEEYAAEWITMMRDNSWLTDNTFIWSVAWRYALAGDVEGTLAAIRDGLDEHSYVSVNFNIMPEYDFLRDDPRFRALVTEIGLEP